MYTLFRGVHDNKKIVGSPLREESVHQSVQIQKRYMARLNTRAKKGLRGKTKQKVSVQKEVK